MTQRILCRVMINAVEAKDMPQLDLGGNCDALLQIVIGQNSRKTKPVMKSLTPIWNEQFDIEVYDLNTPVEFTVLDWDRLTRNDVVGSCKLNLGSLPPGKNDLWLGLGQVKDKNPHIHVVVEILPRIHVTLIEAKELPSSDLFGGNSDPYVQFTHLKNVKRSATIKKSLNPVWTNEHFDFDIHDLNSPLVVEVFDWDLGSKSDLLGKAVITMTSLKLGVNDIWLALPKGSIHVIVDALGFGSYDPKTHVQPIQQSQQNLQQNQQEVSVKKEEFVQQNLHTENKPVVVQTVTTQTVSHDQKPVEQHKTEEVKKVETKSEDKKDGDKKVKKEKKDKGEKKEKKDKGEKKEKKEKKPKKDKADKKSDSSSDSSSSSDSD